MCILCLITMAESYRRWLQWENHLKADMPPHLAFTPDDARAFLTMLHFVSAKEIYEANTTKDKILLRLSDIWVGLDTHTPHPTRSALDFYGVESKVHKLVRRNLQSVLVRTISPQCLDVLLPIDILRHIMQTAGKEWLFVDPANGWVLFDEPDFKGLGIDQAGVKKDMVALPHWLIDNDELSYSGCMWDVYRKLAILIFDPQYREYYQAHVAQVRNYLRLSWNHRRSRELLVS